MRSWLLGLLALVAFGPVAAAQPVDVHVDLLVIGFGNYDVNRGTYTMDFYLHLWYDAGDAPEDFDVVRFEFTNGRASSKELQSESMDNETGRRDLWYRIQANLYSDPVFRNYPYDKQQLRLVLEDATWQASDLQYRTQMRGSGLDEEVRVAGWRIDSTASTVSNKTYPFYPDEETYSRFTFTVEVSREPVAATLRSFLPPLAFLLVASFSFFLDPAQPVPRLTLGTGMLISAVGFHLSQIVNLPAGRITFFDKAMITLYAFIACCIFVTVALAFGEKLRFPTAVLTLVNKWGAVGTFLLPAVTFLLLTFI